MGQVKRQALPVFNNQFELGIRMVYLLQALMPQGADLQKLVLLDYAVVYSADLNGPSSLHTPIPFRGAELMSRRELIEQGLYLMSTRGLVTATWGADGITYFAGEVARTMTGALTSSYLHDLEQRCAWAAEHYAQADSTALTAQFAASGHLWGAELELMAQDGGGSWV
ncbi:threonine transporter [Pseudomonas chlororaphis subsp. aurantiaca]|uniref:ABC-three component system middle component 2 n=1 Tax=Pseudomonas chlororaphis TaxID=587753 RepID=UPI0027DD7ED1|nr:ABC-three component system middle component 2 [Pseudomonas chlororaphis]WMI98035.1 threonine transporter [Pseudomonas chlororaphis subsp. aurantiaca]